MVRADGIEPTSSAWKAEVLPLNYARKGIFKGTKLVVTLQSCQDLLPGKAEKGPFTIALIARRLRATARMGYGRTAPGGSSGGGEGGRVVGGVN